MTNPFEVEIPAQHRMIVDERIWAAKLDDSYHLGRIIKWLLDNRLQSEEVFDAYDPNNISGAVIDILGYLCDCEKAVNTIREAMSNV